MQGRHLLRACVLSSLVQFDLPNLSSHASNTSSACLRATQVLWTPAPVDPYDNETDDSCDTYCGDQCLFGNLTGSAISALALDFCPAGRYNAIASVLLQSVDEVAQVRADLTHA